MSRQFNYLRINLDLLTDESPGKRNKYELKPAYWVVTTWKITEYEQEPVHWRVTQ